MPRLKLSFLGAIQVSLDGKLVRKFRSVKAQALLAYLAMEPKRPHLRAALSDLLWPASDSSAAQQNLRQTLRRLCLALAENGSRAGSSYPFLTITRHTVQFNIQSNHWLDVVAFRTCLEQKQWERAVELYQGHFLAGLDLPDSDAFEQWAVVIQEHLQSQVLQALEHLTQRYLALADHQRAQACARRQLAWEPAREQAHRQLMLSLAASGQRGAALAQYEVCRHSLLEQLGIEPTAETHALYTHLRDAQPLSEIFPPASPAPLTGCQINLIPFIERLQDPACRLLTLVGPHGSGKSKLVAQAAAEQKKRFRGGVIFVSRPLLTVITQALGLTLNSGGILGKHHKQILLALDDSESRVPRAWVRNVLEVAPQVKILLASTQALRLPGEYVLTTKELKALPGPPCDLCQVKHTEFVPAACREPRRTACREPRRTACREPFGSAQDRPRRTACQQKNRQAMLTN